jgi:hypothetical protein
MNFLATVNLITKLTLHNIHFLKIWYNTLLFMVEAHGFKIVFVCCVFISTSTSDKCDIKHYGENQGEI